MPEEYRRLIFSDLEIITAIKAHSKKVGSKVHLDKLKFITIGGDKTPYVNFAVDTEEGETLLKYEGAQLAAALIRFCIGNRIPMPQKSFKQVSAKDHKLIMDIKVQGVS